MKKSLAIILAIVICLSSVFVACSNKSEQSNGTTNNSTNSENVDSSDTNTDTNKDTTKKDKDKKDKNETTAQGTTVTPGGLSDNSDNYILDTVEVTDKNGKTVTEKDGTPVTTDIVYREVTNKDGESVAVEIDDDGEEVTKPNGDVVTSKINTTAPSNTTTKAPSIPDPMPSNPISTVHTEPAKQPTEANLTTIKPADDKVPLTTDSGTPVKFSDEDAVIVAQMLSVPYLYNASYENSQGVPTNIAGHAAMWMANREGLNTSIFASGTIVLDLFKFFGQTVVNFKTKCNNEKETLPNGNTIKKDYTLKYSASNDTFIISNGRFEDYTHTVDNLSFYNLGNNNYYKVVGTVKGAKGISKVTAVIQRNKLDSTLGFSIKALQWS